MTVTKKQRRHMANWVVLLTIVLGAGLSIYLGRSYWHMQADLVAERTKSEMLSKRATAVLDSAPVAIIVCDTERTVTLVNDAAEELFGYTEGELIGAKVTPLIALPEELAQHRESFDRVVKMLKQHEGPWEITRYIEGTARKKDGRTFRVLITVRGIKYNGEIEFIAAISLKAPSKVPVSRPLPRGSVENWSGTRATQAPPT